MHGLALIYRTARRLLPCLLPCLIVILLPALAWSAVWQRQKLATHASLRGLAVVNDQVIWASGTGGTFLRSVDGGHTWTTGSVAGAGSLDFRDVEALDGERAWLMSAGPGEQSRVYFTHDGGRTWTLQLENHNPKGFFDAIAFFDSRRGLLLGDPVNGRFELLRTVDGGAHWRPVTPSAMPAALPGEGAFAASGTCLITEGRRHAWFATGGGREARVFRSGEGGQSWQAAAAPLQAGSPGTGIFSLAFIDARQGIAIGGDYLHPNQTQGTAARTRDGGRSWSNALRSLPGGYRSAVAYRPGSRGRILIVTGPNGTDVSRDGGTSWRSIDHTGYNCVRFAPDGTAWLAGAEGRMARLDLDRSPVPSEK